MKMYSVKRDVDIVAKAWASADEIIVRLAEVWPGFAVIMPVDREVEHSITKMRRRK